MTRSFAGCLLGGALLTVPLGPTTTSRAVDQINAMSMRPLTVPPPLEVTRPSTVWVPDRYVPVLGESGLVHVPGHWERSVSEHESYAPPTVIWQPEQGKLYSIPAGPRPPANARSGP